MLVKCKCHGNKIEKNDAYCKVINGKRNYYCSEQEYIKITREKENRLTLINLIFSIIGTTTNTALMKELAEISKVHTYTKMLQYVQFNKENLQKFMSKNFTSEFGKIRYFTAIIKNQIGDFKPLVVHTDSTPTEEVIETVKYTSNVKKSITDYIDEY